MKMLPLLLAGCLLSTACLHAPNCHPWQTLGTANSVKVSTHDWRKLSDSEYERIPLSELRRAAELLQSAEFVALDGDQAASFCPGLAGRMGSNRLFLVRGVAYGSPAFWSVRHSSETGQLFVYHASWEGENGLLGNGQNQMLPTPLVVALPAPPTKVYAIANLGGDGIFSIAKANQVDYAAR